MDAFESLVATLLRREGYWVETSLKVELTREDKVKIGRSTNARWEVDVVAYDGAANELIIVECKSFLDSSGVRFRDGQFGRPKLFKLFTEPTTRKIVMSRLAKQMVQQGRCGNKPLVHLGLAVGHVAGGTDRDNFQSHFESNGWWLFDDNWIAKGVRSLAETAYENSSPHIVAKILERNRSDG